MSSGLKIFVDPKRDKIFYDHVMNNFLEEGIIVNANYDPGAYIIRRPISAGPGSHMLMAMSNRMSFLKESSVPLFPKECSEDQGLKIMKGKVIR